MEMENDNNVLPKRKGGEDTEMDITPMIDVTFLLLIFFVVASKMDPQKAMDLPMADNGLVISANTSVVLVVSKGKGKDVVIYKGNAKKDSDIVEGDPLTQEQIIQQYVQEELAKEPTGGEKKKNAVLIMGEKGFSYRHIERVRQAVAEVLDPEFHSLSVAIMETQ